MGPANGFWRSDAGAITVDWTVLAAAVVGLGVSSVEAVRSGTDSMGSDVETSLTEAGVVPMRWLSSRLVASQSFADGNFDGWSAARAGDAGSWGPMQGPFGVDTLTTPLTYDVELSPDASNALVEFDLVIADSWDGLAGPSNVWTRPEGDVLHFQINGQTISTEAFVFSQNHPGYASALFEERSGSVQIGGATYHVRLTPTNLPTSNVTTSGWVDQRWRVQIEAVDAPQSFQLGFSAAVTGPTSDEAFGIANFTVAEN